MHSSSKGTDASYNVQIATDAKHNLIVTHEVTNDCDDSQQLANIAIQAKETLGVESLVFEKFPSQAQINFLKRRHPIPLASPDLTGVRVLPIVNTRFYARFHTIWQGIQKPSKLAGCPPARA